MIKIKYTRRCRRAFKSLTAVTAAIAMTAGLVAAGVAASDVTGRTIIAMAADSLKGKVNDGVTGLRIRTSTDTSSTANVLTSVNGGFTFDVIESVSDGVWYHIAFMLNGTYTQGYISGSYVTVYTESGSDDSGDNNTGDNAGDNSGDNNSGDNSNDPGYSSDADFEAYMDGQGFPGSYREALRTLHAQYPNWIFRADYTGKDWNDVISNENKLGRSLIYSYAVNSWKSTMDGAYNWETGEWTELDSGGWVQASKALVMYAVDPRNFLNATNVFMFENLSYNEGIQSEDGVNNIIKNTFMANSSHDLTYEGASYTYSAALMLAGKISGVSPYHLATRIVQEQGVNGASGSISGTVSGYENLFNYYNQGAYKTADASAIINGLKYASRNDESTLRAWTTRMRSIIGGAIYIGRQYINKGQNTLYYEKFDLVTPYTHQYMTNILAPRSESRTAAAAYTDDFKNSTALVFNIPVYSNMPSSACAIPTGNALEGTVPATFTGMAQDSEGVWRYYEQGTLNTGYTGMASNDYGWWYFTDGTINTEYTGMAENDSGWWYFSNGVLDQNYTGLASNDYGTWYFSSGSIAYDYSQMVLVDDIWSYVKNGKLQQNYTGMALNEYGWWYFNNGALDLSFTGMALNDHGWWYYSNGTLDAGYTGLADNDNGTWYFQNGSINFGYTGMVLFDDTWSYVLGGQVNTDYTGMASNEYGWWYFSDGAIDFGYTGMASNDYGWWYYSNGALDTGFTGIASNDQGTWYYKNGMVNFDYTGMLLIGDTWRYVLGGQLMLDYTGMAANEYGWWYFNHGDLDVNYTGMACNENGWWYFTGGSLDVNYTGMACNEYGWWYYTGGRLDVNYTGMALNEYGWWYYSNGRIDLNYTGPATNEYGTWHFTNGVLD